MLIYIFTHSLNPNYHSAVDDPICVVYGFSVTRYKEYAHSRKTQLFLARADFDIVKQVVYMQVLTKNMFWKTVNPSLSCFWVLKGKIEALKPPCLQDWASRKILVPFWVDLLTSLHVHHMHTPSTSGPYWSTHRKDIVRWQNKNNFHVGLEKNPSQEQLNIRLAYFMHLLCLSAVRS